MTPRSLNLHILSDFAHVYGRFFSSKSACVTSRDQNEQSEQSSQLAKEEEEHIDNGGQEKSLLSGGREKSSQLYNVG